MTTVQVCEDRYDGDPCAEPAGWRVRVGNRNYDAQLSCNDHLGRTCQVMADAEGGREVWLNVLRLEGQ